MTDENLEPVLVGGRVASYRPVNKKASAKKATEKKAAASSATKAQEANR